LLALIESDPLIESDQCCSMKVNTLACVQGSLSTWAALAGMTMGITASS
jgi:hypothetical protein